MRHERDFRQEWPHNCLRKGKTKHDENKRCPYPTEWVAYD